MKSKKPEPNEWAYPCEDCKNTPEKGDKCDKSYFHVSDSGSELICEQKGVFPEETETEVNRKLKIRVVLNTSQLVDCPWNMRELTEDDQDTEKLGVNLQAEGQHQDIEVRPARATQEGEEAYRIFTAETRDIDAELKVLKTAKFEVVIGKRRWKAAVKKGIERVDVSIRHNGASVFSFYDNFTGNSLTSNWNVTQDVSGTATYSVNNGLSITVGTIGTASTVLASLGNVLEANMTITISGTAGYTCMIEADQRHLAGGNAGSAAFSAFLQGGGVNWIKWYEADGTAAGYNMVSGATITTISSGTPNIWGTSIISGRNSTTWINYAQQNTYAGSFSKNMYILLGSKDGTGAGSGNVNPVLVQWVRVRTALPVNAMPSSSFGSLTVVSNNPTLTIQSGYVGSTTPTAGTYTNYTIGSTVTISETPNSGYSFRCWNINGTEGTASNPLSFTINGNTTVQPIFYLTSQTQFSIIEIPDTQNLAEYAPANFNALTTWIATIGNTTYNLKMVIHTGDIVDDNTTAQWTNANTAMMVLYNNGIPYVWCAGNHDQIPNNDPNGDYAGNRFDAFNITLFQSKPYYVSSIFDKSTAATFSFAGRNFLVIDIEYAGNSSTLTWVINLLNTYPNYSVIIGTHMYLSTTATYTSAYTDPVWAASLQAIINLHPNVFLTINGHDLDFGSYCSNYTNVNGREEVFFNRQLDSPDGQTAVRIYTFNLSNNTCSVTTYVVGNSTWLTDQWNQFAFQASLGYCHSLYGVSGNPFVTICGVPNVNIKKLGEIP